jgi:hypothetical protein
MTCRISRFQDGGSLINYITIFLAEGIWKVHIFRHLFVCFQTSVYMLGEFHKNRNNSTVFEELSVSIPTINSTIDTSNSSNTVLVFLNWIGSAICMTYYICYTHFINMHKYIDPSWPRTNGSLIYIWPWRGLPITNLYNKVRSDLSQVNRFLVSDTQINSTYMYNLDRHDVAEIIVYLSTLSNT